MVQDCIVLTEAQLQILEKRKCTKEAHGEIESEHYLEIMSDSQNFSDNQDA